MITYNFGIPWGVLIWGEDSGQKIVGLKIDGCLWLPGLSGLCTAQSDSRSIGGQRRVTLE